MSFRISQRDPENLAKALGQANVNKNALAETTHASLGYASGSPMSSTPSRYAGDLIAGNLGINGEFAAALRDPGGQKNLQAFTELLYNGPFSPLPPPIM